MIPIKNVFTIIKDDSLDIIKNPALLVIIIGLIFLPSLYAWFNIKASWDPYGNTEHLRVALVNSDKGDIFNGEELNLGNDISDELHSNSNLGWVFLSKKEAMKQLNQGKVFAVIEIPKSFTNKLLSILSETITKPTLNYYVNEKINPVAPKITNKGATSLQEEIQSQFLSTASGILLETFTDIGVTLEENIPLIEKFVAKLNEFDTSFPNIEAIINEAIDTGEKAATVLTNINEKMAVIESTIEIGKETTESAKTFVTSLQTQLDTLSPVIKKDISIIQTIAGAAVNSLSPLLSTEDNEGVTEELVVSMRSKVELIVSHATAVKSILTALNEDSFETVIAKLDSIITKGNTIISYLSDPDKVAASLAEINKLATDIQSLSSNLLENYDTTIKPGVKNFSNKIIDILSGANTALNTLETKLPDIYTILNKADTGLSTGEEILLEIKADLPEIQNKIHQLALKATEFTNEKDLKEIAKLLVTDVTASQDFISNPVELKENSLYPIKNYGTALAPFYTSLSIWVGITLLVSILTVGTTYDKLLKEYKAWHIYLGRFFNFLILNLLQTTIIILGELFILKVPVVEVTSFFFSSFLISLVFVSVVYTLTSVFGDVGKALVIVLLVFQISSSGGVFPVQLSPHFFQVLNPYLPFTYSISLLREFIGGSYTPTVLTDILSLCFFLLIFTLFGIFFKKTINKLMYRGVKKAHESRLLH